jgi:hypothetical protein
MPIINTRADLDALEGTPAYVDALAKLNGSMTAMVDAAVYPEGYGQPGYQGADVAPDWQSVEDLSSLQFLGFTKTEFAAVCAAAGIS